VAGILKAKKKISVVSMLCEGARIRANERITGINRNTIMNLGVRVGAYGWSHPDGSDNKTERFLTVLEIPPVDSP